MQTTAIFGVEKGARGDGVDGGNSLCRSMAFRGECQWFLRIEIVTIFRSAERTETLLLFFDTKVQERDVPLGRLRSSKDGKGE